MLPVFALLARIVGDLLASRFLLSLWRSTGSSPGEFVGLDNYGEALFRDDIFHQAVGNTVAFTLVAIVLQTGVGLLTTLEGLMSSGWPIRPSGVLPSVRSSVWGLSWLGALLSTVTPHAHALLEWPPSRPRPATPSPGHMTTACL